MSDYRIIHDDELMHYGVPGMRWGHRKAQPVSAERSRYKSAKENYKKANRDYSKAYDKAYNYSSTHPVSQWSNGHKKAEADRRWSDAYNKGKRANQAKLEYKQAKKEYKQTDEYKTKQNKALKIGAAASASIMAVYGATTISTLVKLGAFQ